VVVLTVVVVAVLVVLVVVAWALQAQALLRHQEQPIQAAVVAALGILHLLVLAGLELSLFVTLALKKVLAEP